MFFIFEAIFFKIIQDRLVPVAQTEKLETANEKTNEEVFEEIMEEEKEHSDESLHVG